MSEGANKWVMPIGALVVGAVAGFIYPQSQNSKLSSEVASLTSSLGEQTSKAKGAAAEVAKLTEGLAGRTSALDEAKKHKQDLIHSLNVRKLHCTRILNLIKPSWLNFYLP